MSLSHPFPTGEEWDGGFVPMCLGTGHSLILVKGWGRALGSASNPVQQICERWFFFFFFLRQKLCSLKRTCLNFCVCAEYVKFVRSQRFLCPFKVKVIEYFTFCLSPKCRFLSLTTRRIIKLILVRNSVRTVLIICYLKMGQEARICWLPTTLT